MTSLSETSLLAGSSGVSTGYTIDKALRFEDGAEHILHRRVDTTWQSKFTISFWIKRCNLGLYQYIITWRDKRGGGYPYGQIQFDDSDRIAYFDYGTSVDSNYPIYFLSNRRFRDTGAWYHVVAAVNYADFDAGDPGRFKLWINGRSETDVNTFNLADQAPQTGASGAGANYIQIGRMYASTSYQLEHYLAEFNFIDGYDYGPEYFGEFNSSDIWIPKEYSGSYSNESFYLSFADTSDIGNDDSGNSKDFTAVGLAAGDVVTDSPTNNHCTWNTLTGSAQVYSEGNLKAATASSAWKGGLTTMQVPLNSGIWYYEMYIDSAGSSSGQFSIGWSESDRSITDDNSSGDTQGWVTYAINGKTYNNASSTVSYGATYTTGDVIGCKIDTDTSSNNITFYKNGASQGNLSEAFNAGTSGFISPYILLYGTRNGTARFASNEWTQTPTGITEANAINSVNLGAI